MPARPREVTFTERDVYNTDPGAPKRAELLAEVWERAIQSRLAEERSLPTQQEQPKAAA